MDVMSDEKRTVAVENTHMLKLIATKVLFCEIERSRIHLMRQTFQEINSYGRFDQNCQSKLKLLAGLLHKQGLLLKSEALGRWNFSALKPSKAKKQNEKIAESILKLRLLTRPFHQLCLHAQERRLHRDSRSSSLRLIQFINNRSGKLDLKRSIQIWKEKHQALHKKAHRVRRLV